MSYKLLVHNHDGTIGILPEAESLSVNLSVEQKAILQAIAAAVGAGPGGFNLYGEALATPEGSWTEVASVTVLVGETLSMDGLTVWGDADAEWSLEKTSGQIGGARTSPSNLLGVVRYETPITVVGPDVVKLKVYHWYTGKTVNFRTNLEGRIV
jgi:hypothetical protein